MTEQATAQATSKEVALQKIFVKDLSFESPSAPGIFMTREWKPQTNLNLRSSHRVVGEQTHEVVLTITVEAKLEDKTVFLVELHQAGLFQISGVADDELGPVVGSFCPNILYPYAREAVSSLVQRGGFPEFLLQPIDFDSLYAQSQQQAQTAAGGQSSQGNGGGIEPV